MVNWKVIIEAPIAVILLYVAVVMIQPLQDPLFGTLSNSIAFPYGSFSIILIQLITLVLTAAVIYLIVQGFTEPPNQPPAYVYGQ